MEKETELYLINRLKKLEQELNLSNNALAVAYDKQSDTDITYEIKAHAFDELVKALGIKYNPKLHAIVLTSDEHSSVRGLPHIFLQDVDVDMLSIALTSKQTHGGK